MSQLKTVAFGNGPGDVSVEQALLLNTINRAFLREGETGSLVKVGDRHDYHFCREGEKSDFFIQFHKGLGSHGTMSLCSDPVKGPEIRKKLVMFYTRDPQSCLSEVIYTCVGGLEWLFKFILTNPSGFVFVYAVDKTKFVKNRKTT